MSVSLRQRERVSVEVDTNHVVWRIIQVKVPRVDTYNRHCWSSESPTEHHCYYCYYYFTAIIQDNLH